MHGSKGQGVKGSKVGIKTFVNFCPPFQLPTRTFSSSILLFERNQLQAKVKVLLFLANIILLGKGGGLIPALLGQKP